VIPLTVCEAERDLLQVNRETRTGPEEEHRYRPGQPSRGPFLANFEKIRGDSGNTSAKPLRQLTTGIGDN